MDMLSNIFDWIGDCEDLFIWRDGIVNGDILLYMMSQVMLPI